jgi:hypothetical protein
MAGTAGGVQEFVQVRFLLGQAESEPFREYLMVAAAERAVGVLSAQQSQKLVMTVPAGTGVP